MCLGLPVLSDAHLVVGLRELAGLCVWGGCGMQSVERTQPQTAAGRVVVGALIAVGA